MKIIYVAGPFRGKTPWDVECNVRRAETSGLEIARLGAMPLIPHTNTRFFDGQLTAEFWIEGTLELLRRADAIYLCQGWEFSKGTVGELTEARSRGMPIFNDLRSVQIWLETKP